MNKLHTLLLAFSTMTSATAWAEAPALQSPALATSSEAKESPFKKLMALLAKAKQQQAQGQAQGPVAPAPAVSSGQELVSLIKSQGLSFKDALEKMGVGVNKRFSKRLNGKRGQKLFLNRIKKEGLSWQDAAASLKPAAAAEAAPLASNTSNLGDAFSDFENYLINTYAQDSIGADMWTLVNAWKQAEAAITPENIESFTNAYTKIYDQLMASSSKKYAPILSEKQMAFLNIFNENYNTTSWLNTSNNVTHFIDDVYNIATSKTSDATYGTLAQELVADLKTKLSTAYNLVQKSLERSDFDNADTRTTATTDNTYTGLTLSGRTKANCLEALQSTLNYSMGREGLGRLIYGGKTIAALATYSDQKAVTADPDFLFACKKLDSNGVVSTDLSKVYNYSTLINDILTKVPAISAQYFNGITLAGKNTIYVTQDTAQTLSAVSDLTTYLSPAGYAVTNGGKNQSLTLQLLAAASDDAIESHWELSAAEKPGAYFMRQLLNGGSPSDAWLARDNTVIKSPAGQDEDAENRRNPREQSQENPSEERNIRPNNRNNVSWE